MTISFSLSPQIEQMLRENGEEPNQTLKEAALVEFYRLERITQHELGESLGLGRLEVDALLKRHDVPIDLSAEEFASESDALRRGIRR